MKKDKSPLHTEGAKPVLVTENFDESTTVFKLHKEGVKRKIDKEHGLRKVNSNGKIVSARKSKIDELKDYEGHLSILKNKVKMDVGQLWKNGLGKGEIVHELSIKYNTSIETIKRYVEEYNKDLKETYKQELELSAELIKERFEQIYKMSLLSGDYSAANKAMENMAKMMGLEEKYLEKEASNNILVIPESILHQFQVTQKPVDTEVVKDG